MGLNYNAAIQTWMDQQDKLAQKGQKTGIRKFREKLGQENGNKLIIFAGDPAPFFDAYEVFILCGTNVHMPTEAPEAISKKDIPLKHGALRE
jgi:hypothetical protein